MPIRQLAALVGVVALALPATALAHVRLAGAFVMTGQVTAAGGVPGEYVGEPVTRMWDFVAPCPAGQCRIEALVRPRAAGQDHVKISHRFGVFDHWVGRGSFFAPLMCGARVYPRGERVFFKITVQITGATVINGAPVATSIRARYESYRRSNRTRCVFVAGHDAAVYTGQPVTLAPPAPVPPAPVPPAPVSPALAPGQSGSPPIPG